eukprot:117923-Rhodomonas_salina.1
MELRDQAMVLRAVRAMVLPDIAERGGESLRVAAYRQVRTCLRAPMQCPVLTYAVLVRAIIAALLVVVCAKIGTAMCDDW